MLLFVCMSTASAAALVSVKWLARRLIWPEIIAYWSFVSSFEQLSFIIVSFNMKAVHFNTARLGFWTLRQSGVLLIPILIVWFLALAADRAVGRAIKVLAAAAVLALMLLLDYLYCLTGLLTFVNWTFYDSALLFAGLIGISGCFMALYRVIMRRGGIRG
ncbi:hypothetical protein [Paenibacillus humicola]|uniref:hypothetical protein n=1 Tax=Paenibacillus humicola TaxID=3110540 RepID=UPI00237A3206|nr:hypothetical protein [Paenibacillus humicola]